MILWRISTVLRDQLNKNSNVFYL